MIINCNLEDYLKISKAREGLLLSSPFCCHQIEKFGVEWRNTKSEENTKIYTKSVRRHANQFSFCIKYSIWMAVGLELLSLFPVRLVHMGGKVLVDLRFSVRGGCFTLPGVLVGEHTAMQSRNLRNLDRNTPYSMPLYDSS